MWRTPDRLHAPLRGEVSDVAIRSRVPGSGGLHRSNQGVLWAVGDYQTQLDRFGIADLT